MKIGIIAIATLLLVGFMAVEGVATNETGKGLLTGSAEASCIEFEGHCVWYCPPSVPKYGLYFTCPM